MQTCRHFRGEIPRDEADELRDADPLPCAVCDAMPHRQTPAWVYHRNETACVPPSRVTLQASGVQIWLTGLAQVLRTVVRSSGR